mgnify:FL=1|tara:strand:+ start:9116 stop:9631 length:516 start_codon:yes stop_codon:yes gene_type:complete
MTARQALAKKILNAILLSEKNQKETPAIAREFASYNIQMKRGYKKDPDVTAREEAVERIGIAAGEEVLSLDRVMALLHPFRVQEIKKKYPRKAEETPRKKSNIVCIKTYKDEKSISYGHVAGGPVSRSGSKKICPKCNSMGLHLAVGYKEKYYSCVYCGFHKDLETKTLNY